MIISLQRYFIALVTGLLALTYLPPFSYSVASDFQDEKQAAPLLRCAQGLLFGTWKVKPFRHAALLASYLARFQPVLSRLTPHLTPHPKHVGLFGLLKSVILFCSSPLYKQFLPLHSVLLFPTLFCSLQSIPIEVLRLFDTILLR